MAMTDPLGDMLTRIRNGQQAKKDSVLTPASKLRANVLEVLQRRSVDLVVVPSAWVQSGGQERACCDQRNVPQQGKSWRKISAQHGALAYVHLKHGQGRREH